MIIEDKIRRLSQIQITALNLIAKSKDGIISSVEQSKSLKKEGRALGGVFSSLSRQRLNQKLLIIPWGRPLSGKGLRWKLNQALISQDKLLRITNELMMNV